MFKGGRLVTSFLGVAFLIGLVFPLPSFSGVLTPWPFSPQMVKTATPSWSAYFVNVNTGTWSTGLCISCPLAGTCQVDGTTLYCWSTCGVACSSGCASNYCHNIYSYTHYRGGAYNSATYDWDGDGLKDNVDPFPEDPLNGDTDSDGVLNTYDPWPADANCPGTGRSYQMTYGRSDPVTGCTYQVYKDMDGACGEFVATTCTSGVIADMNFPCPGWTKNWDECLSGWRIMLEICGGAGSNCKETFASLGFSASPARPAEDSEVVVADRGDMVFVGQPGTPFPSAGVVADSDVSSGIASDDMKKLAQITEGVVTNTKMTVEGISDLSKVLNLLLGTEAGMALSLKSLSDGTSLSGGGLTEAETAAAVQAGIEAAEGEPSGSLPGAPDVDGMLEDINDMSGVGQEENEALLDTDQSALSDWLDSFLEGSGLSDFFSSSGVEIGGTSCELSGAIPLLNVDYTLDFCQTWLLDFLDIVGIFLLSFAYLRAIFMVFAK